MLATVLALTCVVWPPASAAPTDPDLAVRISALSPTRLTTNSAVTMSGTVTNNNDFAWENVQAYLVIPQTPYTSRKQLDDAISSTTTYTGERVVDLKSIAMMGDLTPGQTASFTIKVPYDKLGLNGSDGVYPVGVQILGTGADGHRSNDSIGRATTFLPMLAQAPDVKVAASIGWPFLLPAYRGTKGTYVDVEKLLALISPGGQLRNLLDLAGTMTGGNDTVIIDPALLVAADDLAHRRNIPKEVKLTDDQVGAAAAFRADLLTLVRSSSCWIVGYDRPDVLALQQNTDLAGPLSAAVEAATSSALGAFGLTGRRVTWPSAGGITAGLLEFVRGPGDQPVIVEADDVPGWSRRDGSIVQYQTDAGPVPLLVDDAIDERVPGQDSVVALRQRIVSESALAILLRAIDPNTKADAVALVPPTWNPGTDWAEGKLTEAFSTPWIDGASLDKLLTNHVSPITGKLPSTARAAALSRAQLDAAAHIHGQARILKSIHAPAKVADGFDEDTASAVSLRWRKSRETGLAIARSAATKVDKELAKISISGPQSVTLSGSNGTFPLTISNDTREPIKVGVQLESSNPALSIPDVVPTTIDAGERHTINVNVDVGDQGSTFVTARMVTPDNLAFGDSAVFTVRSSVVGAVLWVALGLAALLVIVAMGRRFARERKVRAA